ncbi:UNVERIFIED_CONTAM: hypothetical protein Q9R58_07720 [Methylobacteriaceae bacterium AG10]|nr:hypothetical protein [Methylobacteriaceae bacterium AG10]
MSKRYEKARAIAEAAANRWDAFGDTAGINWLADAIMGASADPDEMSRSDERAGAIAEVATRLKNHSLSPCLDCAGQGYTDQGKSACFWCRGAGVITQQMAHAFGVADRADPALNHEEADRHG